MMGIHRTSNGEHVEFCERCARVYDQACRIEALRDESLTRALFGPGRLS